MKKLLLIFLSAFLFDGCATPPPSADEPATPLTAESPMTLPTVTPPPVAEKVKETKTFKGIFRGFEAGAYRKAAIEMEDEETGSLDDYFVNDDEALLFFLAAHLDKPLEFTYNVLERPATQRGGSGATEKLVAAKDGTLTYEAWWQQQKAANPDENALRQKFNKLIANSTLKDDEQ